jgi:hypothetical protein
MLHTPPQRLRGGSPGNFAGVAGRFTGDDGVETVPGAADVVASRRERGLRMVSTVCVPETVSAPPRPGTPHNVVAKARPPGLRIRATSATSRPPLNRGRHAVVSAARAFVKRHSKPMPFAESSHPPGTWRSRSDGSRDLLGRGAPAMIRPFESLRTRTRGGNPGRHPARKSASPPTVSQFILPWSLLFLGER